MIVQLNELEFLLASHTNFFNNLLYGYKCNLQLIQLIDLYCWNFMPSILLLDRLYFISSEERSSYWEGLRVMIVFTF